MAKTTVILAGIFPAQAGVGPRTFSKNSLCAYLPRTSGGGPKTDDTSRRIRPSSPHKRGWAVSFRVPILVMASSPHKRGWAVHRAWQAGFAHNLPRTSGGGPEQRGKDSVYGSIFPAQAGVGPRPAGRGHGRCHLPRTSGGKPANEEAATSFGRRLSSCLISSRSGEPPRGRSPCRRPCPGR